VISASSSSLNGVTGFGDGQTRMFMSSLIIWNAGTLLDVRMDYHSRAVSIILGTSSEHLLGFVLFATRCVILLALYPYPALDSCKERCRLRQIVYTPQSEILVDGRRRESPFELVLFRPYGKVNYHYENIDRCFKNWTTGNRSGKFTDQS